MRRNAKLKNQKQTHPPPRKKLPSAVVPPVVPGISPLLTTAETARALHVGVGTVEIWRSTHRYPLPFVRIGRRVFYRAEVVQNFLLSREGVETTPVDQQWRARAAGAGAL